MAIDRGSILLGLARNAIAESLGETVGIPASAAWLDEPGATFVTLTLQGELRGCIGTLLAERPLREDVTANARAAAFRDPRFPPVTPREYRELAVEVSLLSPLEPVLFESESHLLSQLRPGEDGVLLEHGWQRGTFLPQVWEQLPEPGQFIARLKQKAGLPDNFWSQDIKVSRYTVNKWREDRL
ncbi:MAG: AmmeMemoRadiSam system protein A [Gammaproteobacteria bacterium]|nr:AmmeMemoRadiSam system protein A [Gammaproteobacteria bacterium]